jgi:hypothetical protein
MNRIELSLPVRLATWSTNMDRRLDPFTRAEIKAGWKQAAFMALRAYKSKHPEMFSKQKAREHGKTIEAPMLSGKWIVTVVIPFDTNHRRDPSNYCGTVMKAVIDGLVKARAWPDDGPAYVGHREPVLVVDRKVMPKVILEQEETP